MCNVGPTTYRPSALLGCLILSQCGALLLPYHRQTGRGLLLAFGGTFQGRSRNHESRTPDTTTPPNVQTLAAIDTVHMTCISNPTLTFVYPALIAAAQSASERPESLVRLSDNG